MKGAWKKDKNDCLGLWIYISLGIKEEEKSDGGSQPGSEPNYLLVQCQEWGIPKSWCYHVTELE